MSRDLWILIAIVLFVLLLGGKGKKQGTDSEKSKGKNKSASVPSTAERVYIPHYMKDDEYKCPVCKARFWKDYMVCPNCGTKFTGTKEDDGEFMEEMVIWDDEDDD